MTQVVDYIPIEYDEEKLRRELNTETVKEQKIEIAFLIEESHKLVEPKSVYTYLEVVKIAGDHVHLESGDVLKAVILADMLRCGQKVAPYVITIGPKLEDHASELKRNNLLQAFFLDKIGNYALNIVKEYMKLLVEKVLGGKVSDFGPGEGTGKLFRIEQQEVLFRILQPFKNIGVQLTPSCLMIPRKSVSGVFAVMDEEYIACQYCPSKCDYRKSAFKGEYHPRRRFH